MFFFMYFLNCPGGKSIWKTCKKLGQIASSNLDYTAVIQQVKYEILKK